jgi:hypothetical protein
MQSFRAFAKVAWPTLLPCALGYFKSKGPEFFLGYVERLTRVTAGSLDG